MVISLKQLSRLVLFIESAVQAVSDKMNQYKFLINTYHAMGRFSRRQIDDIFLIFPRK